MPMIVLSRLLWQLTPVQGPNPACDCGQDASAEPLQMTAANRTQNSQHIKRASLLIFTAAVGMSSSFLRNATSTAVPKAFGVRRPFNAAQHPIVLLSFRTSASALHLKSPEQRIKDTLAMPDVSNPFNILFAGRVEGFSSAANRLRKTGCHAELQRDIQVFCGGEELWATVSPFGVGYPAPQMLT
jgi:hypothetical protein